MRDDTPPLSNVFAARQHMLVERLHLLLATLAPELRADTIVALEGAGKLLSQPRAGTDPLSPTLTSGVWPLLTLLVAQHVSPDIDPTYTGSVAVAVECFVCALDLLDDVEDEDQTRVVQTLGAARTLNVSTTLLMLAQRSILALAQQGVAPTLILSLLDTLQASALVATYGQHRDLLAEKRPARDLTFEECIAIAAAKAGAIMRLACRLGAVCAGASQAVREQFSSMGELLGVAHQLDNDAHDLYYLLHGDTSTLVGTESPGKAVKTDLVRKKKTLPVVLAALSLSKQQGALDTDLDVLFDKKEEYLAALHEAIVTTWGISLLYSERARDRLQEIEAQRPADLALHLLLGFE